ncbi:T9SS C-terminal target domain-containing protein [Pontibacter diazotrophicus]|uniref:T9SS C-terminal target domain-containing protein n=1 Tax=Pontibacter diazotrophicus TaxID=1400979 RepID=A0A3D8LEI8_9BACT|nr:S8 family serine peptidase [Pontibacter diazotrophicus]RDV15808.1 T9SS C-terminal target domain-containing protein [Pontibacter diazotrophicus]
MLTLLIALKRILWSVAVAFVFIPLLYAQRPGNVGSGTVPHTVVYKLKPQFGQMARSSQSAGSILQSAMQEVGAQQVQQKFPKAAAQAANVRRAAPAVDLSLIYELKYDESYTLDQVQKSLMSTGLVVYVEPLYVREPLSQPNDPAADSTKSTQYYLKLLQAYEGWAVEKGDTNVVVAILDTGFRLTHEELKSKVKHNYNDPVDGIDNDGDGYIDNFSGWDFADKDNNVDDDTPWKGHGTSVAAVSAGATNNGSGIASLGYNTKFLPLKVFSSVTNGSFGGYEAIVYAANKGCKVINLSWGGEGQSQYEQDIINYAALDKDVLIVASGGNTNKLLDIYPASYENVLSVGGTNAKDVKYKDHTYSYRIDLTAPSDNIYTATINNDRTYGGAWGTSFSSPIVAGGAALVRAKYPELNARQAAERIRVSTDDIYELAGNQPYLEKLGKGRFNLKKALKQQNLKSVRCTSYGLALTTQIAYAGSTVALETSFLNYLSPTTALQVTLTSASTYVSMERGTLNLGSVATMATATSGLRPFILNIAEDAPTNHTVHLRLGFSDGDYEDFQYITLVINPSFVTLTANDLHVSLNNVGNIGYNGLNFKQGIGVKYKGGPSLLFEGGLVVATDAGKVSDNLHNEKWLNDANFISSGPVRLRYDTPLATQEARTLMEATGSKQAGVRVKQVASAWMEAPDRDYIIFEYQITNVTPDTIAKVHAGLFADWDIGNYMQNAAAWDDSLKLGYVYNKRSALPYAGIKLLTKDQPVYHAIDNMGGNDSTVTVDDGFTDAEKYKIISNGVSRVKAGGRAGNNVSHIVGATLTDLAPGEIRTVAVALLAADNLTKLKVHAAAAQEKYISIKSGPMPTPTQHGICAGSPVMVTPDNGSVFNFYADEAKSQLIGTADALPVGSVNENRTIYVTNADSLFESTPVPYSYIIPDEPVADFNFSKEFGNIGLATQLTNKSKHTALVEWNFGDGTTSTDIHPSHTYKEIGMYEVTLTASDSLGCVQSVITKQLQVYSDQVTVFPNPTDQFLIITLTRPIDWNDSASSPRLTLTDMAGKSVSPPSHVSDSDLYYDVSTLAAGVYIAHIMYNNTSSVKRILVRH